MKIIYFAVVSSKAFADKLDVFKTYFLKEGGFDSSFWIWAFGLGIAMAIIYYLICRFSYSFSKRLTWFIALILTGVISYLGTGYSTGISSKSNGIRHTVEVQFKKKSDAKSIDSQVLKDAKRDIQRNLDKGIFRAAPITALCWSNFFYSMIFFYLMSIVVNGLSVNAAFIPHRGLIKP